MSDAADKISPTVPACGNCKFAHRVVDNLALIECKGLPPTPILMGYVQGPTGPNPSFDTFHPRLAVVTPACALHQPKPALILGGSDARN